MSYNLMTGDGRPVEAMAKIIELRKKELGETTSQACTAMMINVLKSLRADTPVAKLKGDITVSNVDSVYTVSWKRLGPGKNNAKRVLRAGKNGPEVNPERVVWRTRKYRKNEEYHVFSVVDKIGETKTLQYLMVATSERAALSHANQFHKAKVKKARKLAKFALGLAMHGVHAKQNASVGTMTQEAKSIGLNSVAVQNDESGFNSGDVKIHVEDNLKYAAFALKHGEGYVQTAVQKALNSMTGYLASRLRAKGVEDQLKVPFPEIAS